ncbi:MAG: ABC transporter transmembrane domain-containing protein [Rhodospirillales bacterium]
MENSIFRFIMRYSWKQQVLLLVLTIASFPFLYASLELPKTIVNKAIQGSDFPKTIYGITFDQFHYLFTLCGIFLLLVAINGGFKYVINVYKGLVGERMLRRFRYQLFTHTLRFPIPHFRRTSQGELIAMITAEVEPLGGFIGDAVALPAFQGGTLLTIIVFMFVQDWVLGTAAVALYPLQVYFIPKLQRQVNQLAKERVRTVRRLSQRIGEAVTGIGEIHGNDTSEFHRADFARWVGKIFDIRFIIYRKKFFIKFLNNFIAQLTPFFFFSIGGYLVIKGQLSFGALVAVLSAYKDLSSPWKELLDWYQLKEDSRVKYDQLFEQFIPAGLLDETLQKVPDGPVPHLSGRVVAQALTLDDEGGLRLVDRISFEFELDEKVALVGPGGSGTDDVARMLARLVLPTGGSIRIGDDQLATLPEAVTGRRIAFVGEDVALISGSIRDNLYYPLRRQPLHLPPYEGRAAILQKQRLLEASRSGNTLSDTRADWIDWGDAGAEGQDELKQLAIRALAIVDLESDMFALGLRQSIDPKRNPRIATACLVARERLRERLADRNYKGLVETFDPSRYNSNMSLAENLLFGTPIGPTFDPEHIAENAYMRSVLDRLELTENLTRIGYDAAKVMIDLMQGLAPDNDFFERFSFISAEALPELQAAMRRVDPDHLDQADAADRARLLALPFKLVPSRHRLGLLDAAWTERLLAARRAFAADLPADLAKDIAFFDPTAYNAPASVQDNILFGKIDAGRPFAQRKIGALITEVIEELGLRQAIANLGLDFDVGIGGSRLSATQRQKIAVARALLKRPDLLILDRALAALDPMTQPAVLNKVLGAVPGGVVCVMNSSENSESFDRMIVMENGRIAEQGLVKDLREARGTVVAADTAA